jgi:AhpD family alkylhydroperoxidase
MQTLDPYAVSPKEMQELISLHAFLDSSGLEESLIELLRLHVSLLNSCAQGVRRHCRRLSMLGETTERLLALGAWRSVSLFTEKERAALEWSEAVTFVSQSQVPDGFYAAMREWFTDIEIVKLTMIIAATTAWNRMEMSFPRSHSEAE